jgi:hypothetical protein
LKISPLKIGFTLVIIGMIWISFVFLQGDKTSKEFTLNPANSMDVKFDAVGRGMGYYKVTIPEFSGEQIFVQILDSSHNVVSEQSIQTKMSLSYFKFNKSGQITAKITNISEDQINLQFEIGNTNSEEMIPSGIVILVGSLLIIVSSYLKLKNYKIEQPDENIS